LCRNKNKNETKLREILGETDVERECERDIYFVWKLGSGLMFLLQQNMMVFRLIEDEPLSRVDSMEHVSRISSSTYTTSLTCSSHAMIEWSVTCFFLASSRTALIRSKVADSFSAFYLIPKMVENSFWSRDINFLNATSRPLPFFEKRMSWKDWKIRNWFWLDGCWTKQRKCDTRKSTSSWSL